MNRDEWLKQIQSCDASDLMSTLAMFSDYLEENGDAQASIIRCMAKPRGVEEPTAPPVWFIRECQAGRIPVTPEPEEWGAPRWSAAPGRWVMPDRLWETPAAQWKFAGWFDARHALIGLNHSCAGHLQQRGMSSEFISQLLGDAAQLSVARRAGISQQAVIDSAYTRLDLRRYEFSWTGRSPVYGRRRPDDPVLREYYWLGQCSRCFAIYWGVDEAAKRVAEAINRHAMRRQVISMMVSPASFVVEAWYATQPSPPLDHVQHMLYAAGAGAKYTDYPVIADDMIPDPPGHFMVSHEGRTLMVVVPRLAPEKKEG